MTRVEKTALPDHSLLRAYLHPGDYLDAYSCASTLDLDEAVARAMDFPAWVMALLALRNIVVAPFDLIRRPKGARVGIFPTDLRHGNEMILGFNDRHLDFRVSLIADGSRVYGSTWVHTHNLLGRAYLTSILPFHILIMRQSVARTAT